MLRVEDGRTRPPLLNKPAIDKAGPEIKFDIAPSVPLIARDSYVAETASKIEQLKATMRLMDRDLGQLATKVAALESGAEQQQRWQGFQKNERHSKELKLEEALRGCRDLKARLDRIEARSSGDFHAYNSFEAISRKLAELESFRDGAKRLERTLKLKAWLLCASIAASAVIIGLAHALAN